MGRKMTNLNRFDFDLDYQSSMLPYLPSPELRLMWAVILRAIADAFVTASTVNAEDKIDAITWLMGETPSIKVRKNSKIVPFFTFYYCCEVTGLNYEASKARIRDALDKLNESRLSTGEAKQITHDSLKGFLALSTRQGYTFYH